MISQNLLKKAKKLGNYGPLGAPLHFVLSKRAHALCGVILLKI
jgi:hypothetical protein